MNADEVLLWLNANKETLRGRSALEIAFTAKLVGLNMAVVADVLPEWLVENFFGPRATRVEKAIKLAFRSRACDRRPAFLWETWNCRVIGGEGEMDRPDHVEIIERVDGWKKRRACEGD